MSRFNSTQGVPDLSASRKQWQAPAKSHSQDAVTYALTKLVHTSLMMQLHTWSSLTSQSHEECKFNAHNHTIIAKGNYLFSLGAATLHFLANQVEKHFKHFSEDTVFTTSLESDEK